MTAPSTNAGEIPPVPPDPWGRPRASWLDWIVEGDSGICTQNIGKHARAELAALRQRVSTQRELLVEAFWWLTNAEAHGEANGTGQIKKWMRRVDALLDDAARAALGKETK